MITYAADSHEFYGELVLRPAGIHQPRPRLREIYEWDTGKFLGRIAQAPVTYSVVGNINEHQVAIGGDHLRRPRGARRPGRHRSTTAA